MVLPRRRLNKAHRIGVQSSPRAVARTRRIGLRGSQGGVARTLRTALLHSRFSRRRFLRDTAGAGLLLGIAPQSVPAQGGHAERRTLFFNFSRPEGLALNAAGQPAHYFVTVGGQTYPLQPVSRNR